MKRQNISKTPAEAHTCFVVLRAAHLMMRQVQDELEQDGLSLTDFAVLEVLLNNGPQAVNVIGPKVRLTPGAISVAVDRLLKRGLVTREEDPSDRRIRTVSLTKDGEKVIVPVFQKHLELLTRMMEPLTPEERTSLEDMMKKVGKHAEALGKDLF